MATLSDIYNWFMTGKKPTQAQFWASWGSFWNKGESIPQSAISNLSTVLNAKAEKSQLDGKQDKLTAGANITIDPDTKEISAVIPPSENIFTSDFDYNFGAGKGLGILTGSGVYPTIGKTHEQFLREIANDNVRAFFISFGKKVMVAPYDGGVDFVLKDSLTKENYKNKYKQWLSEREDGY